MRGSVRKRGSTWTWYLDVDPNPLTGRRRQQTKGVFKTRKECEAALRQAIADQRGGTLAKPSQRTIASFLADEWLPAVKPSFGPRPGPATGPIPTPTSSQCSGRSSFKG
jgi:Arm DNA-binding domain